MPAELDFTIRTDSSIGSELQRRGFDSFHELTKYIRQLPYGRPACMDDMFAVLKEQRGTCSYKHRLLAMAAQECGHPEVELIVGLYSMCEQNSPGVGAVLEIAGFSSIPEAHCYLQVGDQRYDFTGLSSGAISPFDSLLSEHAVPPVHLFSEKEMLHREAIRAWAGAHGLSYAAAWSIREACINELAAKMLPS